MALFSTLPVCRRPAYSQVAKRELRRVDPFRKSASAGGLELQCPPSVKAGASIPIYLAHPQDRNYCVVGYGVTDFTTDWNVENVSEAMRVVARDLA